MSLVEKALNKLKAGSPAYAERPAAPPAMRIGRVVDVERQKPGGTVLPQPRAAIGNGLRTVRIDHDALRASGFLPPEQHERELAHQFRTIKRLLIRHAFPAATSGFGLTPSTGRSIMVSSALPGVP